jgi:hypothetical protein
MVERLQKLYADRIEREVSPPVQGRGKGVGGE